MKNFFIRLASGAVYVAIIIAALFTTMPVFFAVFGVVMLCVLNEFYKNLKAKDIYVDVVMTNVLALCIYLMPIIPYYFPKVTLLPAVVLFALLLFAVELFKENEHPFHRIAFGLCGIVYTCLPFTLLAHYKAINFFGSVGAELSSIMILFLFLLIWVNDVFAYLVGMLLGKHPLCPKISPKKTIEGFVGGLVFTILVSIGIMHWFGGMTEVVGLAVIVVIFSTLGDLVESRWKRYLEIKDSGKIMPGHGGFLDRFDSVIFSIPAFFAYLQLF
ncbi:MAG: phosphatidate cytidylyltransferase [Bacteroidales bacterium]|nr:phosphatidate cytidylyltransferase [Bacteroidales bacterium]